MRYIAIVAAVNGKITKYADFSTQAEADAHVATYGGFVFNNVNDMPIQYINVDWANQTATAMTQAEIDAELAPEKKMGINRERDRRIDLPKSVSLTSGKAFTVDMANGGRQNIGDLGTAALAKASINDTSTISFRDADNVDWDLTNEDIIEMGLQVTAQVSSIHVKARAIKALNPIPSDYTDDSYWI